MVRLAAVLAALLLAGTAQAGCRLALVLAVDTSSSIDEGEFALQREGIARALEDPEVRAAFLPGYLDPVALAIFEWSGARQQRIVQDWVVVDDPAILDTVAARVRTEPRASSTLPTSIGNALRFSWRMLQDAPACEQWTVDVSGDGISNDGMSPRRAYLENDWTGITVNGLAIGPGSQMVTYYSRRVIRGPNAFVERAVGFEDFGEAMQRKLIRELLPEIIIGQSE